VVCAVIVSAVMPRVAFTGLVVAAPFVEVVLSIVATVVVLGKVLVVGVVSRAVTVLVVVVVTAVVTGVSGVSIAMGGAVDIASTVSALVVSDVLTGVVLSAIII